MSYTPKDFVGASTSAFQSDPNDVTQRHLLYDKYHDKVKTTWDVWNGKDTTEEYLFQFPQEKPDTFKIRKERATLRNFVKRSVDAFTGMIYHKPVEVKGFGTKVRRILPRIDTQRDLQTFMRQLTEATIRDGKAYILIDSPQTGNAQPHPLNAHPYFCLIDRLSLINWRRDTQGRFLMAVIEEVVSEPYGPFGTNWIRQWRHYYIDDTRGMVNIAIYRQNINGSSADNTRPNPAQTTLAQGNTYVYETIETGFDYIPLVEVDVGDMPPLYDVALMNIKHFNRQSHKDRYLTMAALPIPVIWGADVDPATGETQTAKPALVIGVDEAFIFHGTKDEADFEWRELSGNSLDALQNDLEAITEDIVTGILRAADSNNAVEKSATEVYYMQAESSNRITTIATAVEAAVNRALIILSDIYKERVPEGSRVIIAKDFNPFFQGPDAARVLLESYLMGLLSTETFLKSLNDMELINIGSAADEIIRIKNDTFELTPRLMDAAGRLTPLNEADKRTQRFTSQDVRI